jgi:biotin operon repressor
MAGRPSIWAGVAGQALVLAVNDRLEAAGWVRTDNKAVRKVIQDLCKSEPYRRLSEPGLRTAYYRARRIHGDSPGPIAAEQSTAPQSAEGTNKVALDAATRERWLCMLQKWGKATKRHPSLLSAQEAGEIVNRLIAVSSHWHAYLDQLFVHMDRRIHWNGRQKIKWLLFVIDRLAANPLDWPIPISRRGRPDVTAGRIETYLANAPAKRAHKRDIVSALAIPGTTGQTTLCSMERAGRIVRVGNGIYALPMKGVSCAPYIPADKAILDALGKGGQRNCAELRAETGKSEGAVHAALHRLRNAGSIVLTKRGRYALAGSAPPHVYARDAISDALRSGKKAMPELIAATGKNRGEIWAALRRLEAKGRVIQVALRGQLIAFALSANQRRRGAKLSVHSGGQADRHA